MAQFDVACVASCSVANLYVSSSATTKCHMLGMCRGGSGMPVGWSNDSMDNITNSLFIPRPYSSGREREREGGATEHSEKKRIVRI